MNEKKRIVLASQSPRRLELLKKICDDFEVCPSSVKEILPPDIEVERASAFLAAQKCCDVAQKSGGDVVIGCDTIVVFEGEILGKPKDYFDAFKMLKKLSGNEHTVYTGVCIIVNEESFGFVESTKVVFDKMTNEEINECLRSESPYDKAGSYAIQGAAAKHIKKIDGDYYNVMGLPINHVYRELKKRNIV